MAMKLRGAPQYRKSKMSSPFQEQRLQSNMDGNEAKVRFVDDVRNSLDSSLISARTPLACELGRWYLLSPVEYSVAPLTPPNVAEPLDNVKSRRYIAYYINLAIGKANTQQRKVPRKQLLGRYTTSVHCRLQCSAGRRPSKGLPYMASDLA